LVLEFVSLSSLLSRLPSHIRLVLEFMSLSSLLYRPPLTYPLGLPNTGSITSW